MIRTAELADSTGLIELGAATGLFRTGEAEALLGGVLEQFHSGKLGEGHQVEVWVASPAEAPSGWVYFAPTALSEGVWDLWWIGVEPARQRSGIGGALLEWVETRVGQAGGRLLIIETSSRTAAASARKFYTGRGYHPCGVIPDFYADGDDKVIFSKRVGVTE